MDNLDTPAQHLREYEWLDVSTLELFRGDISLRITFLDDDVIRCHYVKGSIFDRVPSYGIDAQYLPTYPKIKEFIHEEYIEISTRTICVRVRKIDMGLEFFDIASGRLLCSDAEGMGHRPDPETGDDLVWMLKHMPPAAHFFGLGDKPYQLNLRGRRFEMWASDHYDFKSDSDPLYKCIPFFLSMNMGISYGVFFDNTMRSYFDFGKDRDDRLLFGADGGQMDYYFIGGRNGVDVVANYTKLTGLPSMPPLWSLGYHQSRWSYYPQKVVEGIIDQFREKRIPCDSVHLDIHHMKDNQSLTWDETRFPDPRGLIEYYEQKGMKCVTIVNPGVRIEADLYMWRSGFEKNVYCRRHDGALLVGEVWPGDCHFPDFTSPQVRRWWKGLFDHQIAERKVRGFWLDMNEPALFPDTTFPKDTRHEFEGYPCSHLKAHNIYGQAMSQATHEAMLLHAPRRRPFILSRAGYAGMQRYAATWTGDNTSDWSNLKMANLMVQRLATSGVSFAGSDTGGFMGCPSPELYCRWLQLSAFHLFFRTHSDGNKGDREPWSFGTQAEKYCRAAIEQRYRLLPYFYTLFYQYSTEGLPVIRSLALQHGDIPDTYWRSSEFFVGNALYVIPVHHHSEVSRMLYLPPGRWYSFWNDECIGVEEGEYSIKTPPESIPVLVKAGCIIPRWPVQQYVGEIEHPPVTYDLWWGENTQEGSFHYEDAGDGYDYEQGHYLYHHFLYQAELDTMKLTHTWSGNDNLAGCDEVDLIIHGLARRGHIILTIDKDPPINVYSDEDGCLKLKLQRFFRQVTLDLSSL